MDKVYCLKFYFNEYNQLGGYTKAVFRECPSFHQLKSWFVDNEEQVESEGLSFDACIGKLSRGEPVSEFKCGGGNEWAVVEVELL
jgi:hypothetical protein